MRQQQIIQWLPLEVALFGLLAGWLAVGLMRGLSAGPLLETRPSLVMDVGVQVQSVVAEADPPVNLLSAVFTPEVQHWAPEIVEWAGQVGVDPNLAATVMQIESCGDPQAVSPSGAQGLFQVMPFHFEPGEAMQDPDTNARRGLAYLALGLERAGGQVGLALAGYNGGHSQIGRDAALWPEETRRYYYWGAEIYQAASSGLASSERLDEWLAAGGASLCSQAADRLGLAPQNQLP